MGPVGMGRGARRKGTAEVVFRSEANARKLGLRLSHKQESRFIDVHMFVLDNVRTCVVLSKTTIRVLVLRSEFKYVNHARVRGKGVRL